MAIIPDGNRRWAKKRGLPVIEGHRKGAEVALKLLKKIKELDIKVLTFWAFSTENWRRKKEEQRALLSLFEKVADKYFNDVFKNKIHFVHIGRKDRISKKLREKITELEEKTKQFKDHYFVMALDYGGHDEISRAVEKYGKNFAQFLDTRGLPYPNPDLVIRTSSEMRTSGFMIWQAAYSEWIFYPKYFPDFTPDDFEKCIEEFKRRQRRFGR